MGGIAGIYHLDGRPVDSGLLQRLTTAIAHRGPDGIGHWIDGTVGLGHCAFHTTPESLREKQPLYDETSGLCLTFDGRVDNREELKKLLLAAGLRLVTDTDGELVLRAYEYWGESCPEKIFGDFAFVIWDKRKRRLFCARDILGLKPLYYYTDGHTFRCGSELQQILTTTSLPRKPNEGMVGEYLATAIADMEETLFQGIYRLPPAHSLIVQDGKIHKTRYWDIDPSRTIHYRDDQEYAEHFLAIFKEAVCYRLRSHGRVGAQLSGGVDSSSIVGIVESLGRNGTSAGVGFETFSLVFPDRPCDESAYIQDVVRLWDLKANTVAPAYADEQYYCTEVHRSLDFPYYPNGALSDSFKLLARDKGFRVLLTGLGGDEWLTGSYYHYADLLRQGRILACLRQYRCDARLQEAIVFPPLAILKLGLRPLLPSFIVRMVKWLQTQQHSIPPWINRQFADRIQLIERYRKHVIQWERFRSFSQAHIHHGVLSGLLVHMMEIEERSTLRFNLELRHPFHDRRIIEFALAIPEEQRWQGDTTKVVLRQAVGTLLPETIRQRRTKADFSHAFAEILTSRRAGSIFENLTIAALGWVDGKQVHNMYNQMAQLYTRKNNGYIAYIWSLWMVYGIEMWFNQVFEHGKTQS